MPRYILRAFVTGIVAIAIVPSESIAADIVPNFNITANCKAELQADQVLARRSIHASTMNGRRKISWLRRGGHIRRPTRMLASRKRAWMASRAMLSFKPVSRWQSSRMHVTAARNDN